MTTDNILKKLFSFQDVKYGNFNAKLIPNIEDNTVIGVRTPDLRAFAKELYKYNKYIYFINALPHKYFDENQLHAFIISEIQDYNTALYEVNRFLPYINNWATCDQLNPKVFKKNTDKLINEIFKWLNSGETYTIRFGIDMLMKYYLSDCFNSEYFEELLKIKSDEYYVNMALAWYFATALSKQYDSTIVLLENKMLSPWVHNKTIQKARESLRITPKQKEYLKKLKI